VSLRRRDRDHEEVQRWVERGGVQRNIPRHQAP